MKDHRISFRAGLLALLMAAPAYGQLFTLTDHNSSAALNLGAQTGMYNWTVDGASTLFQQWFWYRIGPNNPEASINTIGAPTVVTTGTQGLSATYTASSFNLRVDYSLTGGTTGSGRSDMQETITIRNTSATALDFHFFQYSDFDLPGVGSPGGDNVSLGRNSLGRFTEALQTHGSLSLSEVVADTVTTPGADHGEAGYFADTLNRLNDGLPTTLNDNPTAGPGDVTWAFEWDLHINPGDSAIILKDKNLQVPEPTVAALVLLGLGAVTLRRKK